LNSYFFEYWFRYSGDQKDFEQATVVAKNEEDAKGKVLEMRKWIYYVKLLSINGEKIKLCQDV